MRIMIPVRVPGVPSQTVFVPEHTDQPRTRLQHSGCRKDRPAQTASSRTNRGFPATRGGHREPGRLLANESGRKPFPDIAKANSVAASLPLRVEPVRIVRAMNGGDSNGPASLPLAVGSTTAESGCHANRRRTDRSSPPSYPAMFCSTERVAFPQYSVQIGFGRGAEIGRIRPGPMDFSDPLAAERKGEGDVLRDQ